MHGCSNNIQERDNRGFIHRWHRRSATTLPTEGSDLLLLSVISSSSNMKLSIPPSGSFVIAAPRKRKWRNMSTSGDCKRDKMPELGQRDLNRIHDHPLASTHIALRQLWRHRRICNKNNRKRTRLLLQLVATWRMPWSLLLLRGR